MIATLLAPATALACQGDFNGDGTTTVDEVVVMISHAIDGCTSPKACEGDFNGDQMVTVDEVLIALNEVLLGCPTPTSTPSVTGTPTRTRKPTETPTVTPTRTATPVILRYLGKWSLKTSISKEKITLDTFQPNGTLTGTNDIGLGAAFGMTGERGFQYTAVSSAYPYCRRYFLDPTLGGSAFEGQMALVFANLGGGCTTTVADGYYSVSMTRAQ